MQTTTGALNRRRTPRVPCGLFVNEIAEQGMTPCQATNLSEGGIYLRRLGGGVLLEGETVQLELALPGESESVWASGRVIEQVEEAAHDGAAIEFVSLTWADRLRLRRYVARVRRRQLREALTGVSRLVRIGPEHRSAHTSA
jgi:hypothetical protein